MIELIGILSFVAGGILGGAIVYYFTAKKQNDTKSKHLELTLKNVLANHAKMHVSESRNLVDNIQQQCEALSLQLTQYENAINTQTEEESKAQVEYFSEQESTYLRHSKINTGDKTQTKSEAQPRDYAAAGSGLFTDEKDSTQTETKKQD
jgi:uncharacterized membrane-anchored protein YhcB (DUF1043 family)